MVYSKMQVTKPAITKHPRKRPGPREPGTVRSDCPVAGALDVIGDRWTLLVVRDLLLGRKRYGEFLASAERIPTNILANRLRRLKREGVVESVLYHQHPPRFEYQLTDKGRDLAPAITALIAWGSRHIPGTVGPELPILSA